MPADFQFGFKVTEEITVKHFPNHPRAGARRGRANENSLNADLFGRAFLTPCERIRSHVGIVMFEFARFHSGDYVKGADFIADLDGFLALLPEGWPYGIELRNQTWLVPEYFACLARHGVTHVFNSWSAMPSVSEQMSLASSRTNAELTAARFLLKPGRKYEDAVKMFSPYDKLVEVNEDARKAAAKLIAEAKVKKRGKTLLAELAGLKRPPGAAGEVVQREQNYLATHAGRMNYRSLHRRGWPIGSGPVESAWRQRQCRFKRSGQFWTPKGMLHLGALVQARHNHHWDELWITP